MRAGLAAKIANSATDDVLRQSVDAGYKVPPSYARGGVMSRLAEGLSGKYKTNQLAGIKNQEVTNQLAKQAIGITDNTPITEDLQKGIRQAAFNQGYVPVRNAGKIITDADFVSSLDDAVRTFRDVADDFPELVDDGIIKTVDSLKKDSFDAKSGISAIKLLRDKASAFYRAGENTQGRAAKDAAGAIEDQIERHLANSGADGKAALDEFRNARQLIAKTHTIEDAMKGSSNVDATKLAAALRKGTPLTGDLKTAAQFAGEFGDVARVPKSGDANPLTALDFMTEGVAGAGFAATGNLPAALTMASVPASRVAARYGVLSGPVQRAMANKSYDPAMLAKILMSKGAQSTLAGIPLAVRKTDQASK